MNPTAMHNEIQAKTVIENLKKRHMEGFYCKTKEEAVELISSLIKDGSSVSWGGSMTMKEIGLMETLENREDLTLLDRAKANSPEEVGEIYRKAFSADTFIMSSNAITKDGKLVNIDGTGNRVAALIYGPKQVIVVAGMNKIVVNEEEAMSRIRNIASPPNAIRLNQNTPCAKTGFCADCLSPDCICNQVVTIRNSRDAERIKVVLIEGSWGF